MAETPRFEDVLERLQGLVDKLEGGKLSLDESLAAFEEGVGLSRQGAALLDSAERKIELLLRDERDEPGAPRVVPFTPEGAAPAASSPSSAPEPP